MITTTEKPLTIAEASEYLQLKQSYLYKLTHLRQIPFYRNKKGGKLYFRVKDLQEFCFGKDNSNRVASKGEIEAKASKYILSKS